MEKVMGIGGIFFRAKDPDMLRTWYLEQLGIPYTPTSYEGEEKPWRPAAGVTIFEPFPLETEDFGRPGKQLLINFRVRDLDAMVAQLRTGGAAVEVDPQTYPNGRFAHLQDPEGNPIELWQPMNPNPDQE